MMDRHSAKGQDKDVRDGIAANIAEVGHRVLDEGVPTNPSELLVGRGEADLVGEQIIASIAPKVVEQMAAEHGQPAATSSTVLQAPRGSKSPKSRLSNPKSSLKSNPRLPL